MKDGRIKCPKCNNDKFELLGYNIKNLLNQPCLNILVYCQCGNKLNLDDIAKVKWKNEKSAEDVE